jgi:hypothetical protein
MLTVLTTFSNLTATSRLSLDSSNSSTLAVSRRFSAHTANLREHPMTSQEMRLETHIGRPVEHAQLSISCLPKVGMSASAHKLITRLGKGCRGGARLELFHQTTDTGT